MDGILTHVVSAQYAFVFLNVAFGQSGYSGGTQERLRPNPWFARSATTYGQLEVAWRTTQRFLLNHSICNPGYTKVYLEPRAREPVSQASPGFGYRAYPWRLGTFVLNALDNDKHSSHGAPLTSLLQIHQQYFSLQRSITLQYTIFADCMHA